MKALVTGVAGFIGSQLAAFLIGEGHDVVGADSMNDYYPKDQKLANISGLLGGRQFEFRECDLLDADLSELVPGCDVVFHLAGQPGVRLSWATGFHSYLRNNVELTQALLEASLAAQVRRFVYASSSSVYGNVGSVPTNETDATKPYSPYGVTKLAGEHLCSAYAANFGLPTTSIRYFTVYGPRQRPDMAINRIISAAMDGSSFPMYGDGSQVRDFTFVGDIVRATALAGETDVPAGTVVNAAGGSSVTLAELIELVGDVVGSPVLIDRRPAQAGDVERTGGSISLIERLLGWRPEVSLRDGVRAQYDWQSAFA